MFATTVTFTTTATSGSYTVPAGVFQITIVARGADGGLATGAANGPGQGATVTTVVNVTPGDTIRFVIGAAGATGDLESGGGGGTGVFVNGVLAMVAGGGGGEDNTGNGSGGQAGTSGSSGGPFAGTAGSGGNGGGGGGDVSLGDGGGGGGGVLSAGGNVNAFGPSLTTGGGQADTVLGDGLSVSAGGTSNQTTDPELGDGIGTSGGSGFGGGGAASHRESGAGGGYSGGGGGGSGGFPGGGGSFRSTVIAGYVSGSTTAGTDGGGTGINGFVSITYVDPVVRVQKITTGGVGGPFTFTRTNLVSAPSGITTTTVGVAAPAAPAAITVSTVGTAVTLTETAAAGYVFTSASCTDANSAVTGNVGAIGTVAGTTLTIPAANVKSSADFTCVFNNIRRPSVTLTKISNGGVRGFTFTGTNGWASQTITTVTSGVGVTGPTQILAAASTATTITETIPAGYVLTSVTCSGMGAGGTATPNLATGAVAFNAAATSLGSNIACTFTNTRLPTITLTKISNGAVGGFTFNGDNGFGAAQTITTVTSGVGVAGATRTLAAASTITTITETIPAGYVLASATCSGMGGGGTATPNLATGALVLNAAATAAGSNIACTFTNTRLPTITLTKISNGAVGGFTFNGDNGFGAAQTITTVTSGVGVAGATRTLAAASTITTITETIPAGYVLASATCSGMGGGGTATPNLATGALVLNAAATAAGSNIACTFTNTRLPTITLTKISNGAVGGFTFNGDNGFGAAQTITTVTRVWGLPEQPAPWLRHRPSQPSLKRSQPVMFLPRPPAAAWVAAARRHRTSQPALWY